MSSSPTTCAACQRPDRTSDSELRRTTVTGIPVVYRPEDLVGDGKPFHNLRWLIEGLRKGTIPGYKVGGKWRMTKEDVAAAIAQLKNTTTTKPTVQPTAGSLRRRSA